MSEDTSEKKKRRGDSSDVFKERCTTVLILPMQERSRVSARLFGQGPKTKTKQELKNKQLDKTQEH